MSDLSRTSSYNYHLPTDLIAQYPLSNRSQSRLLHLNRKVGNIAHYNFSDLADLLKPDDVLVINNTKVIPARIFGKKETGAEIEVFLLDQKSDNCWECLVKPGKRLPPGAVIVFSDTFRAEIISKLPDGNRLIKFYWQGDFWQNLDETGKMPLPPYIKREAQEKDKLTYQTVYASERGSVAAPTAGLHFTNELLNLLRTKGINIFEVVLRVGLGTFRPVKSDIIYDHVMHKEYCQISAETAKSLNEAKMNKQRIIAVGTTSTRTLESFAENGRLTSGSKWTDLFIYPGYQFQIIDGLITNFHMPQSSLLMLVAAFAGYQNIMKAYQTAVEKRYRFFSYGDAMVII